MKKLIGLLVVVAALAGGGYYWQSKRAAANAAAPQLPTVKVERGPIRLVVASSGRVVGNLEVEIKCKASGEVVELPFEVSDLVPKGKLVVKIDPVDEERMVKQAAVALSASKAKLAQAKQSLLIAERNLVTSRKRAETALQSAQARAKDAQAKVERTKKLLEKSVASVEDYDAAETAAVLAAIEIEAAKIRFEEIASETLALELKRQEIRLTEAQVESDQIALSTAQQRLDDTKVAAPIDGVVTARNVQTGQIISSGISNVGGGTTILTLADLSRIYVLASVDESDIGKVQVGQKVTVTADAYPGRRFPAKVTRIAPKGVNTSNVVTFEVKIEVLGRTKALLRPEMTASVDILIAERGNALLVPAEAVSRKKRAHVVVVAKPDGTREERPVEVGIHDGAQVEIANGLREGESVLVRRAEAQSAWRQAGGGPRGGGVMLGMGRPKK